MTTPLPRRLSPCWPLSLGRSSPMTAVVVTPATVTAVIVVPVPTAAVPIPEVGIVEAERVGADNNVGLIPRAGCNYASRAERRQQHNDQKILHADLRGRCSS